MSNRFYTESFTASVGSLARASQHEVQYKAIEYAFDQLMIELDVIQGLDGITSLSGFPASFAGAAGYYCVVNAAESAIEFIPGGRVGVKSVAGTSYTVLATDAGKVVHFSSADPVTVTVPVNTLAQGDVVCLRQGGAGQVTLVGASGVTLNSTDALLSTRKQHAQIAIVCDDATTDANVFGVLGERNAPTLGFATKTGGNIFTGQQSITFVTLTDATNIATDASLGNNFRVTLAGNRTLDNPSNLADGAVLNFRITQDGTGSRTLAYGSKFKWPGGSVPVLSTAAGAVDLICTQYDAGSDTLMGNILKGFA